MPQHPSAGDAFGRPEISPSLRAKIDEAFKAVPDHRRGALLVVAEADQSGGVEVRAHLAARLGDHFKVAAGAGWQWDARRPAGYVGIEAAW